MQKLRLFSDAPAVKEALLKYGYSKTFEEGGIIVNEDAYIRAIPIVLVLMNGRPLTLSWEHENVEAILEAWYPGTMAGPESPPIRSPSLVSRKSPPFTFSAFWLWQP